LTSAAPANRQGNLPERDHPLTDSSAELERRDLRRLLDDELLTLPEKYRVPVVLCYLEGQTHEEAARRLGWPTGSMSRRLDRARTLLRRRLAYRGLALIAIGLIGAAIASLGIGTAANRHDQASVQKTMLPFKPVKEGGQGLRRMLTALVRSDDPPPGLDSILQLARESVRAADLIETLGPDRWREGWRRHAWEMRQSALDLAQACQENNQVVLVAAAHRLDATCLKCHEVCRQ
jgi:RNA polymerase sigma-70 factor (ECF subfamily)